MASANADDLGDEAEEYEETINKLASNMRTIEQAERLHYEEQMAGENTEAGGEQGHAIPNGALKGPLRVDLAGG